MRRAIPFAAGILAATLAACGPGTVTTGGSLEPWTGPSVPVTEPEGNPLSPNTEYTGTWAETTYYSFDFELTEMAAFEVTAKDRRGNPDALDVKLFSDYVELYSTVGLMQHSGVYQLRLPPGKYNLSLQLLPGVDPADAVDWHLRVVAIEGAEALSVPVPQKILARLPSNFQGNLLNLPGILGENPDFVELMQAWLLISAPVYATYVEEGTVLYSPTEDPVNVYTKTGQGIELMRGEPVLVYELVDLFAARVVTADGLYGIVHRDSFLESQPVAPQVPDTFRVAPGFRMVAPDTDSPARNGGDLVVLGKVEEKKTYKKTQGCLDDLEAELGEDLAGLRLQIMAMTPADIGYDEYLAEYQAIRADYEAREDQCLQEVWVKHGTFITDPDRLLAAFNVLASIREQFGYDMMELPEYLPPVLPGIEPPPPPPEPPAPEPPPPGPGPAVVATGPDETAPTPGPGPDPGPGPGPAPPPDAGTGTTDPQPTPQPPPDGGAGSAAGTAPAPAPAPPQWSPIVPWAHVDAQ